MKETYTVTGMTCAACSARVEKSVAALPGTRTVSVNLLKNSMAVDYDESALTSDAIIALWKRPDTALLSMEPPPGRQRQTPQRKPASS